MQVSIQTLASSQLQNHKMSTSHRLGLAPTLVSVFILFLIASSSCYDKPKSYLDEIKDAVFSMRSFLNAGLEGLGKLAKTIETVEQFVDATIDEDCEPFTCPKGKSNLLTFIFNYDSF